MATAKNVASAVSKSAKAIIAKDAPAARKRTRKLSAKQMNELLDGHEAWVAEAAYFKAEARGFAPGHEDSDWLEAEQEIRTQLRPD